MRMGMGMGMVMGPGSEPLHPLLEWIKSPSRIPVHSNSTVSMLARSQADFLGLSWAGCTSIW